MLKNSSKPYLYTYNALINGLCKENRVLEADNVFGKMLGEGKPHYY